MKQQVEIYKLVVGEIAANCFLFANSETKKAVCFDPGAEEHRIEQVIREKGLELTAIILTHGHMDHIMAVNELKELSGGDIPVYAGALEAALLETVSLNLSGMLGANYTTKADVLLEDNQEVILLDTWKMRCIHTPGHTSGGMSYYFPELELVVTGDTLFEQSIGRADFPTGDQNELIVSIKEKLYQLPDQTVVYCGHGNETTIGAEKASNSFVRG